ncbi:MAG: hypothetical protein QGH42_07020 [Kiritimatiellia bacterium]|jgi:hypothetical protein|nr:hypothetical protein [Kiritimatiellia bacterium]MDP6630789.1 hypothetical protein [Kiritimatiellia bacterium]MDP6809347.1 hypothetical protein [Kiritimatiellia bacterium]MDP7023975.1 hypothetical protein [Kiritimatiellia bacterium]
MIGLINTVCITLLFSGWVWGLKQDIQNLSQPAHDGPALNPVHHNQPVGHKGPIHPKESPLFDQHGKARDRQGVATWTIG